MSIAALNRVHERSRAKGSNLLALHAIADHADDDGRNAWPSMATIAFKSRLSVRAAEVIVRKLVTDGEVDPQWDPVTKRLHLNIRCICDWDHYRLEGELPDREKFSAGPSRERFAKSLVSAAADRSKTRARRDSSTEDSRRNIAPTPTPAETSAAQPSLTIHQPSTDPSTRAREAEPGAARDPVEALRLAWNALTTPPLPRCDRLSPRWRAWALAALVERSFDNWCEVFQRVERSSHCRGGVDGRGWVCTLDWLLQRTENALKVLDGRWDDRGAVRVGGPRPPVARCMGDHDPPCQTRTACIAKTIAEGRAQRAAASA